MKFFHVISDEVHRAKNRGTIQTKALKKIKTEYKTGLSGTPADNKPEDAWSVLHWLWPRYYTSFWKFYEHYVRYITTPQGYKIVVGVKNTDELLREINPWYVRHLKNEQCCPHHPQGVMPWLPPKTYRTEWVDLEPIQRRAYDKMAKTMIAWIGDNEDQFLPAPQVISQLQRLQQFALGYAEINEKGRVEIVEPSAKLDRLEDIIEESPTQQYVVFSQFKDPLSMAESRLARHGYTAGLYTGDQSEKRKSDLVEAFCAGDTQILLGTISAGGESIDGLQHACNTGIFLDRDWSPSVNTQAEDRLHRDGQQSAVLILDIMAKNTVDYGRRQRIDTKREWLRDLLGDNRRNQDEAEALENAA